MLNSYIYTYPVWISQLKTFARNAAYLETVVTIEFNKTHNDKDLANGGHYRMYAVKSDKFENIAQNLSFHL